MSNDGERDEGTPESSSDEECLADLKRKADVYDSDDEAGDNYDEDSDHQHVLPGVFVQVEMEEVDEQETSDYSKISKKRKSKSNTVEDAPCDPTDNGCRRYPQRKKTLQCMDCGEVFESQFQLKTHAITHQLQSRTSQDSESEQGQSTEEEPKWLTPAERMKLYRQKVKDRVAAGEIPKPKRKRDGYVPDETTRHKCDECGKCFSREFGLRTHRRMHGDKNIQCPLCDKTFALKINLGRHLTYHGKNFQCDHCDEAFYTAELRDTHVAREHSCRRNTITSDTSPKKTETNKPPATVAGRAPSADSAISYTIKIEVESDDDARTPPPSTTAETFLKKEDLSYPTQCAIVSKMHKGRSVADICQIYNLTEEVVNELWEDRDEYVVLQRVGKKTTRYMNGVLDASILEWFNNQRATGVLVTGRMLMEMAESFAKDSGFVAFNGSKKWLDRFKKRYNITFRSVKCPNKRVYSANPAESKWKTRFLQNQFQDIKNGFEDADIYTADEVGVYYNASKSRIKKLAGKKFIHGAAKDRLSIFMCTNVTGKDKKKLLVCGTEDPLVHSFRSPDTLPVTYIRHAQGHFTTQMFEEYVKYWNRELQARDKKAICIIDRATIHSKLILSNLKLTFVPWKASNHLMPIKNGVYARFREEFRRLLIQDKAMNTLRGVDRNLTCLEALYMADKAWRRTPAHVISRSFETTGYEISPYEEEPNRTPQVTENDDEVICRLLGDHELESYYTDAASLDQYLLVDEELLTGHGTNGSVFGGNHRADDPEAARREYEEILPLGTERPETAELEAEVTKQQALADLELVRSCLQHQDTSYETFCRLMEVERALMKNTVL